MKAEMTAEEFEKVARLGGITVSEDEKDGILSGLSSLIRAADRLGSVCCEEDGEESAVCPLREDEPEGSHMAHDGVFTVKRIIT